MRKLGLASWEDKKNRALLPSISVKIFKGRIMLHDSHYDVLHQILE